MPSRYSFPSVFDYNAQTGTITPRFNILINGSHLNAGAPIFPFTPFGGLNLFNYVNRDIAGTYDATTNTVTILGFY